MKRFLFFMIIILTENVIQGQTLLDDYDGVGTLSYTTEGTWAENAGVYEGQTGGLTIPNHSYASYDLSLSISNWVLSKDYINVWFGWMDLNRASVSGWGASSYSCGMVLAANNADFNAASTGGYAVGFENSGDTLVIFRFDAGIVGGTTELPGNSTQIVSSGYVYSDTDNGVNFYIELLPDGYWKIYYKAGAQLSTANAVNKANYTDGNATSASTETTYSGSTYKYAGWIYAHYYAASEKAYFDNFGAGIAKIWTGASSTSWSTAGNWNPSGVPSSAGNICIPDVSGVSGNFPVISSTVSCEHLSIQSGANLKISATYSLTVNGVMANNNGTSGITVKSGSSGTGALITTTSGIQGTIERYLTTGYYHYFSSPVSSLAATTFPLSSYMKVFEFTESNNTWSVKNSGSLTDGKGYLIYPKSTLTQSLSGTFNEGTVNVTVSATDYVGGTASVVDADEGWNIVGNPYPSPITLNTGAANDFIDANSSVISGSVYFWDDDGTDGSGYGTSDYAIWNGTGYTSGGNGKQPDGIVEPGQAFLIKVSNIGAGQTVSFNNNMRVTPDATPVYFISRSGNPVSRFWFDFSSPDKHFFNQILIGFPEAATQGIDNLYDAQKLRGNDSIAFYSLIDDKEFAIQGANPGFETMDFRLGYEITKAGNYSISLSNMENHAFLEVYLEDKNNGQNILLNPNKKYSFYSPSGKFNERFIIHFSKTSGIRKQAGNELTIPVYVSTNSIYLDFNNWKNFPAWYSVNDVSGKILSQCRVTNPCTKQVEIDPSGLFIIKILSGGQMQFKKIIVNGN